MTEECLNPNYYKNLADDAAMIQAAVDAAQRSGEKVIIPRHNERTGQDVWMLPRAIMLYTGSTICLDNCHLRQSEESMDNIFKNSHARTPLANKQSGREYDIHIYGVGNAVLDGGNHNHLVERNAKSENFPDKPHIMVNTTVHFHNAERVVVENLRIINARYWGITFHFCSSVRVSNIHFMTVANCPNQDGVDVRLGCNDVLIENISGYTQDDTVALTALGWRRFDKESYVEGMDDSIHDVIVRNITSEAVCAHVRLLNQYGKKLYNVLVENVQCSVEFDPADPKAQKPLRIPFGSYYMDSETTQALPEPYWPTFADGNRRADVCVRIGDNFFFDPAHPEQRAQLGDTFNITVRNIQARTRFGVSISCTLADSLIDNVQMFGDGKTAVHFGEGTFENIRLQNISYAANARHREEDNAQCEGNYGSQFPAAIYFNKSQSHYISVHGVTSAMDSVAVFGATEGTKVNLKARDILIRNPKRTELLKGNGITASFADVTEADW